MLGETQNQFSLTRTAPSTRRAQKQIPISFTLPGSFELVIHYSDPATPPLVTRLHLHLIHSWKFQYQDDENVFRARNPGV